MDISDLPTGDSPPALALPHFPTRQQAFVWRNWERIPVERLAAVLSTDEEAVLSMAAGMGLAVPPRVVGEWLTRGYVTLIKANWHLLPYEQLLQLLDWTPELMAYMLKEEDFLFYKLGKLKPNVEPLRYQPLTPDQVRRTQWLRQVVETHFPARNDDRGETPFAFLARFGKTVPASAIAASPKGSDFELRMLYAYAAPYGDTLLEEPTEAYPEGLLSEYRAIGVNGIWLQGILYTLVPVPGAEAFSREHEKRIENLRRLTEIAAQYDIGVYLYLNEPRSMPAAFFEAHPDWRGVSAPHQDVSACCTSSPGVLEQLHDSTATLFREVPKLAGLFTITMSENLTNCISRVSETGPCPTCSARNPAEIIAEVNNTIEEGAHSANPAARVIAWAWGWGHEWSHEVIDRLNPGVELMAKAEEALPIDVGGVKSRVVDYTISQVGPSEYSKELWAYAKRRGLKTIAKMQLNNTWECSAVPFLPVLNLVDENLRGVREAGVDGLMLGWTLGGCPSPTLELTAKPIDQIARERYGEAAAPGVLQAWERFSEGFREFPFSVGVVYSAPCNTGCMNLLYPEKTGFAASMVGIAYDDVAGWSDIYPEEVFEEQFRKLTEIWKEGLRLLEQVRDGTDLTPSFEELSNVAEAAYCHLRSVYLQVRFVRRRNEIGFTGDDTFREILTEEIDLAKQLHDITGRDSRIGFEASNHYYYGPNDLLEKVVNCESLLNQSSPGSVATWSNS